VVAVVTLLVMVSVVRESPHPNEARFAHHCYVICTLPLLFIVVDIDVVVNNIKVFSVGMEVQQLSPLKLLSRYKVFCTTVNNNNIKYYERDCILAVLFLPAKRIFSVP